MAARRLTDLRYRLDGWLADGGLRACLYAALRGRTARYFPPGTEIVIEGFPRCANTYAYVAFWIANGRQVVVAHHTHAACSLRLGVRRGVPVLVLVRPPLDAVASWLVFRPELSPRTALRAYLRFYRAAARLRRGIVVASFDEVVTDFAGVIEAVNRRFGTQFRPYRRTDAHEARIRHEVEWWDHARTGRAEVDERSVSRPAPARAARKQLAVERLRAEPRLLARAERLFSAVAG